MNDWTSDIKRLVSDNEVKAPDGLLDDIKAEMSKRHLTPVTSPSLTPLTSLKDEGNSERGDEGGVRKRAQTVSLWHYRWVAAAAIVIAIAIPVVWKLLPETREEVAKVTSTHVQGQPLLPSASTVDTDHSPSIQMPVGKVLAYGHIVSSCNTPSNAIGLESESFDTYSQGEEAPVSSDIKEGNKDNEHKAQDKHNVTKRRTRYDDNADLLAYEAPQRNSSKGFSVNAYYGGSTGGGNSLGLGGNMVMSDAEPFGVYPLEMSAANSHGLYGAPQQERKAHHKQPIKVGVSVGYRLNDRWSVNTGVTYCYLSSDFTADGMPTQTQKLHYVGIPLTASYSIVHTRKAEVYVTAGGEVEKLVKGKKSYEDYEDEKVTESRPQWSAKAAVGGAYHITPSVSVYAEPGVSYYFDNHSSVRNVYKDRQTSFSLNVGLRFNLNK